MLNKLFEATKKPELYAPGTKNFWDDEHISKGLLEAHLEPDIDAASRKPEFIDKSVDWITRLAPPESYNQLLDLGCGPGLYCERLYERGYTVTGIDFSKRSIAYAKDMAQKKNYQISYNYMDYLKLDYKNKFDVVILIYCDFAVLSPEDRSKLLTKIFKALKKDGKFIFDVFTPNNYKDKIDETNSWELSDGGFWRPDKHLCLESHFIYPNNTRCNQYTIIDSNDDCEIIRVWDQPFTPETIKTELRHISYTDISIYSDVTGEAYCDKSSTLAVVVQK